MLRREELLEESVRLAVEEQAREKFGVYYCDLPPDVRSWVKSLVIEQLYPKDAPLAVSPETAEEE